jgi:hypothetical protein
MSKGGAIWFPLWFVNSDGAFLGYMAGQRIEEYDMKH